MRTRIGLAMGLLLTLIACMPALRPSPQTDVIPATRMVVINGSDEWITLSLHEGTDSRPVGDLAPGGEREFPIDPQTGARPYVSASRPPERPGDRIVVVGCSRAVRRGADLVITCGRQRETGAL